jgi:glycosyltransferase involved in cell wall biosynthesis
MRPQILHVIPFLWSGAGSVVTRLCEEQRRHGPVAIVTAGRSGGLSDWPSYRRRLRAADVAHYAVDFFNRDASAFWDGVRALEGLVARLRPAVIHAHAGVPTAAAIVARASAERRVRVVSQMYSWGVNRPAWMDRQDTWAFSQADRVVCSAEVYRVLLRDAGVPASRLTYLPWGLPLDEWPFRGRFRDSGERGPVIGFVGRIEPRKGQADLIRALPSLLRTLPGARVELIGPVADNAYAASIQRLVIEYGLAAHVSIPGQVRSPLRHLRNWDLFVSRSSDEGQGLAVMEAMAVGVPVLAMPVAGVSDFLRDEHTGFSSTATTPRGLAREIAAVLASPVRDVVVRHARRLVVRRYSWAATLKAFDRIYWPR